MPNFYVYDRDDLRDRITRLGLRLQQIGMIPTAEEASRTRVLLEIVELAEDLIERGDYRKARRPCE